MHFLVEFTGEHPSLPLDEMRAAAQAENEQFRLLDFHERLVLVEAEDLSRTVKRCSLIRTLSLYCGCFSVPLEKQKLKDLGARIDSYITTRFGYAASYKITPRKHGGRFPGIDVQELINSIAEDISFPVSLQNPDKEVLMILTPPSSSPYLFFSPSSSTSLSPFFFLLLFFPLHFHHPTTPYFLRHPCHQSPQKINPQYVIWL